EDAAVGRSRADRHGCSSPGGVLRRIDRQSQPRDRPGLRVHGRRWPVEDAQLCRLDDAQAARRRRRLLEIAQGWRDGRHGRRAPRDGRLDEDEVRPAPIWARRLGLELGTLLASLLKWTLLASAAGILAGASTALFLRILGAAIAATDSVASPWLLLPVGFAVGAIVVRVLAPDAEGHGTDKVIEAVHRRWGRIPFVVAPVKLAATVITIAAGGSVGKEGPAAQIGAALASALGRVLFLRRRDHRKLVVCGIGAGFAAVFGPPIARPIFPCRALA